MLPDLRRELLALFSVWFSDMAGVVLDEIAPKETGEP